MTVFGRFSTSGQVRKIPQIKVNIVSNTLLNPVGVLCNLTATCSVEEKKMEVCGIIADIKRQGKGQSLSIVIS